MKEIKINAAQAAYLDILRAVAALFVLAGHAAGLFIVNSGFERLGFQNGAVFIFFLLSGFLICYSTIAKKPGNGNNFGNYFIDRFCRIFVAFVPALIFAAVLDRFSLKMISQFRPDMMSSLNDVAVNLSDRYTLTGWVGNLFMLQSGPVGKALGVLGANSEQLVEPFGSARPFWTISIEWWIYMSFGMIAFTWLKGRSMAVWQVPIFLFVSLTPAYFLIGGPDQCLTLLWITGAVMAFMFVKLPFDQWLGNVRRWNRTTELLTIMFCCAAVARVAMLAHYEVKFGTKGEEAVRFQEFQFGIFLAGAIFSLLMRFASINSLPKMIERASKFVAGYSYSLYLTHMQVLVFLYVLFPGHDNDYLFYLLACVVANLVAIVFWWLFERHYHKIGRALKSMAPGLSGGRQRPV